MFGGGYSGSGPTHWNYNDLWDPEDNTEDEEKYDQNAAPSSYTMECGQSYRRSRPELQTMGQGLRDLGATLEGLLPGLLGQAAGRTARFLAEHAWLLILAAVVVFFKRAA